MKLTTLSLPMLAMYIITYLTVHHISLLVQYKQQQRIDHDSNIVNRYWIQYECEPMLAKKDS